MFTKAKIQDERRNAIMDALQNSDGLVTATFLAKQLSVSRQIIVGDIAILRAKGSDIIATARGYKLNGTVPNTYTVSCSHKKEDLKDEIYTILDCGCGLLDVIIEHSIYGQISGKLDIFSKNDADDFLDNISKTNEQPLSNLTNNIHLHTISCPSDGHFEKVKEALTEKGYLI